VKRAADRFTSLKELDNAWATPKGSAFRAFKRTLPQLHEPEDFIRLDATRDRDEIQRLRAAGRIYAGSVHVVLLSAAGLSKLTRP
jgi:hypothetical protein